MNLTSCDNCGTVLDKDKLKFAKDLFGDDYDVNHDVAMWDGEDYVAFVDCPVCGEHITQ
jgi:hypothetical protein